MHLIVIKQNPFERFNTAQDAHQLIAEQLEEAMTHKRVGVILQLLQLELLCTIKQALFVAWNQTSSC
jgi:hypothetical protein